MLLIILSLGCNYVWNMFVILFCFLLALKKVVFFSRFNYRQKYFNKVIFSVTPNYLLIVESYQFLFIYYLIKLSSCETRVFPLFRRAVSHVSWVLTHNENAVFAFTFQSKQSAVNRSLARSVTLRKCFV